MSDISFVKTSHPQYTEYTQHFEDVVTNMEVNLRGNGDPERIIETSLDVALHFYDADSAALVETDLEIGYGVVVSEHCREDVQSYTGRIINVTKEETPSLYARIMENQCFSIEKAGESKDLSVYESHLLRRMGVDILAVAPYYKRTTGYLYLRNPRRYIGLYSLLQVLSYVCSTERNEFKLLDSLNVAASQKECKTDTDVIIKVFGGLSITTKFGTLTESEITSSLAVRLVAYLLLNDTRKVSQRELTDALWSSSEIDTAAKQVKNVVHRTRVLLNPIFPDNLVVSDKNGNYYVNPNISITSDASTFESFCRLGSRPGASRKEKIHYLRQAVKIYHQDFLPNYTDDFWLNNQRTLYHLYYLEAAKRLLPLLFEEGAYSEMYATSSAALLLEPEHSEILYWHIRSLAMMGAMDFAKKTYLQHKDSLDKTYQDMLRYIFDDSH